MLNRWYLAKVIFSLMQYQCIIAIKIWSSKSAYVNHQRRRFPLHQLLICTFRKFPRFPDYNVKDVTTVSPTANKVLPPIGEIFPESRVTGISTDGSGDPMIKRERGRSQNRFLRTTQMSALVNGAGRRRVISTIRFFRLIIFFFFRMLHCRFRARWAFIFTYSARVRWKFAEIPQHLSPVNSRALVYQFLTLHIFLKSQR